MCDDNPELLTITSTTHPGLPGSIPPRLLGNLENNNPPHNPNSSEAHEAAPSHKKLRWPGPWAGAFFVAGPEPDGNGLWPCPMALSYVLWPCPMSYGLVLCPMALSYVLWPCPMSYRPVLCPIALPYVLWRCPINCPGPGKNVFCRRPHPQTTITHRIPNRTHVSVSNTQKNATC